MESETTSHATTQSIRTAKYYLGNLSFTTTEAELKVVFGEYGVVLQVQIFLDRDTGRSRGFAFFDVALFDDDVTDGLNEFELNGRRLTVNVAKPRELS